MPEIATAGGLAVRPLTMADADAVYTLTAAAEQADLGHRMVELEDIRSDWSRPSFDLAGQSAGFFAGEVLVAYGELHRQRLEGYVHPAHRGRGYGDAVFRWALGKAAELGYPRLGQTVPVGNTDAIALLKRFGGRLLYSSWILELPSGASISPVELPAGYRIRAFAEDEADGIFAMMEAAFGEWPDRPPSTIADWRASVLGRADFEPWQLLTVVRDTGSELGAGIGGGGEAVGAANVSTFGDEAWIDQIAVRRDQRGKGLGRALLVAAFDAARAHGATTLRLNTDSRTGALGLYLHVGMAVAETYEHYTVTLAPVD